MSAAIVSQSLKSLPVSLFGAVMGLAGLGLACRGAAPVVTLPPGFSEIWVWLGALALAILLPAYLLKLLRHPGAVRDEFTNPAQLGFCATLPMSLTLVAGGVAVYSRDLAEALWWPGVVLMCAFQVWALQRWISGGIELAQVNGSWMIMLIGGVVFPGPGLALGHDEASLFMFGIAVAACPVVTGLVFYRTVVGPPLPEALRPTWFIFLVPPSLIYANGAALSMEPAGIGLQAAFYIALALAPALLLASAGLNRWPFGVPWWAFTFPLDALASATAHYARGHPSGPWAVTAGLTLAIAVFFVAMVLIRSVKAFSRGAFFG